jgi:hypothetical protein
VTLRGVHETWGWVLTASNAAVGAWALAAHRWPRFRRRPIWWCIAFAQLAIFVQAFVGAAMVSRYDIELPQMHALYGFSGIVAVGILYSYRTSHFMKGKELLLYGLGCLFIMGLGIRAMILT